MKSSGRSHFNVDFSSMANSFLYFGGVSLLAGTFVTQCKLPELSFYGSRSRENLTFCLNHMLNLSIYSSISNVSCPLLIG
jgi:hypothetical protein